MRSFSILPPIVSLLCQDHNTISFIMSLNDIANTDLVFNKRIVIDGTNHVFGILGNVVAKNLLLGAQIVVINADKIQRAGSLRRNLVERRRIIHKKTLTNPKRGPFHHKAPSELFARVIRQKVNYTSARGRKAYNRLTVFDGVPTDFAYVKRACVPYALVQSRFKPTTKSVTLGQICEVFGWTKKALVDRATQESVSRAAEVQKVQDKVDKLYQQAVDKVKASAEYKDLTQKLVALGYE